MRSLTLAVFGVLLSAALVLLLDISRTSRWVNHTSEVLVEIQGLRAALIDAETGERGYLLSGDERHLQPYERALGEVPGRLGRLQALTRDNAGQQGRLGEVERLARERLDLMAGGIAARRQGGLPAAAAHVSTGRGKAVMDAFRRASSGMLAAEQALMERRAARTGRSILAATLAIVLSGPPLAVLMASLLSLRRDQARRRAAQAETARLYAAEQEAHEKAERAVRAREDILAIVSHDLRNPLNVVTMHAAVIRRLIPPGDAGRRIHRHADRILDSVRQMNRMVQDLLDLARLEAGQMLAIEPEQRDAGLLAAQAVEALRPLAGARGLSLAGDIAPDCGPVRCDADRVLQVFSNLIGNAIKFTRDGGVVTVRARPADGEVVFSVADSGVGIPAADLPHLFEPYWQGRKDRRGVGLGLSVAKAIVEAHHGRIWVETAPEQGSTFHFALPRPPPHTGPGGPRSTDERGPFQPGIP